MLVHYKSESAIAIPPLAIPLMFSNPHCSETLKRQTSTKINYNALALSLAINALTCTYMYTSMSHPSLPTVGPGIHLRPSVFHCTWKTLLIL